MTHFRSFGRARLALATALLLAAGAARAQTPAGVGIGTALPNPAAALDISSSTRGLLPPRLSQAERDAVRANGQPGGAALGTGQAGLTVFNTTTNRLNVWDGSQWTEALATGSFAPTVPATTYGVPGLYTYAVPAGITRLRVQARGAGGSSSPGRPGGLGGTATAELAVVPGQVLTLVVGGRGSVANNGYGAAGGYGGGGGSFNNIENGGGATDVRTAAGADLTLTLGQRLLVAGGGGGYTASGNGGGGTAASTTAPAGSGQGGRAESGAVSGGLAGGSNGGTASGGGGGLTSGGGGGATLGGSGGSGSGGASSGNGGGGGGGYFGGGGGLIGGGGGGGSSWVTAAGSSNVSFGVATGSPADGSITLTPLNAPAPTPVLDASNFLNLPGQGQPAGAVAFGTGITLGSDAANFSYDNVNDRLGLGTATPQQRLDVAGTTRTTALQTGTLQLTTGSGTGGQVLTSDPGGNATWQPATRDNLGDHRATQPLRLNDNWLNNDGGASEGLRIDNTGRVGIGTASPAYLLHVADAIHSSGGQAQLSFENRADASKRYAWYADGAGAKLYHNAGGDLLSVTAAGNVGIGTSGALTPLSITPTAAGAKLTLYDNNGDATNHIGFGVSNSQLNYHVFNTTNDHVFYAGGKNGNGTELLRLKGNGQVGIGPAGPNPAAALDISSTTRGLLPPRLTQTQRDAMTSTGQPGGAALGAGQAGLQIFNTSTGAMNVWDGATWTGLLGALSAPGAGPTTLSSAGSSSYLVPAGVFRLRVVAIGGVGGSGDASRIHARGTQVTATLAVTPGETLEVRVAGNGADGANAAGGYNGGGGCSGASSYGGGGGASDVRRALATGRTDDYLATRNALVVAAGGGGTAGDIGSQGGLGGNQVGGNGVKASLGASVAGGGGTLSGPGTAGSGGSAGTQNIGGNTVGFAGGGGGGYYGGGGGGNGGGAGSSWATATATDVAYALGSYTPSVTLTPLSALAPTTGPVLFGDGAGGYTQDAANFSYDNVNNRVGIGTSGALTSLSITPTAAGAKLTLYDGGSTANHLGFGVSNNQLNYHVFDNNNDHVFYAGGKNGDGTELLRVKGSGAVGIGTASPYAKLHVVGAVTSAFTANNYAYFSTSSGFINNQSSAAQNRAVCAYFDGGNVFASGAIHAGQLTLSSDARIKRVLGRSAGASDLGLLQRLAITDYVYLDTLAHGGQITKKVIAQEVAQVLPAAVRRSTQAIPNVYAKATAVTWAAGRATVRAAKPHGLPAAGGRVRLYTPANAPLDVVAEVVDAHTLRFAAAQHPGPLFVYGKYVDDFLSVDYDALTTLNVSATQELARQVAALQAQNAALERQNQALHTRADTTDRAAAAQAAAASADHANLLTLQAQMAALLGQQPQARK